MNSSEHEEVMVFSDEASGLHAILTIHDTALGPARGGTRIRPYTSPMAALDDALALSFAMSLKLAFYELPHGGGKAVIIDDEAGADPAIRRRRLKAFARSLGRHADRFSTGPDLGTDAADMAIIRETASNVIGDDPAVLRRISRATVLSVLAALEAAWPEDPRGKRIGILGLGKIGGELARTLAGRGAELVLADIDPSRAETLAGELEAHAVSPDELLTTPLDVLMPCATGGLINEARALELECKVLCGSANQVLTDIRAGDALAAHGVLYVPDFVANGGGALACLTECGASDQALESVSGRVHEAVKGLIDEAKERGMTLDRTARDRACARIDTARRERRRRRRGSGLVTRV